MRKKDKKELIKLIVGWSCVLVLAISLFLISD